MVVQTPPCLGILLEQIAPAVIAIERYAFWKVDAGQRKRGIGADPRIRIENFVRRSVGALFEDLPRASRLKVRQDRVVRRIAEQGLSSTTDLFHGDAMRVVVCGSGSPLPSPERAQACVLVAAGGRWYVVDIGVGSAENLARWRIPAQRVGGVFLTHFHSDHFGDLGELNLQTWVGGRSSPLRVFGPPGVERVVGGIEEAYALDRSYRTAHHGQVRTPSERSGTGGRRQVWRTGGGGR